MKKIITSFLLVTLGLSLFAQQPKQADNGAKYRIIKGSTQGRGVNGDSSLMLHMNYKLAIESTDSTLAETFSKNSAVYVPLMEPSFHEVLKQLHVGDSAIITLNADSFFMNSFGQARPPFFKEGENIKFTVKVLNMFKEEELRMKQEEELLVLKAKDSVELNNAISNLTNARTTASGLTYVVEKMGKGKLAKKGDKTKVLYKGTLLNGQVFDENLTDGIPFTAGSGQFIPGWEEMVLLMKYGDKVKVFIPWELAYGPRGTGPVPPYSSLIFEMELVSAK